MLFADSCWLHTAGTGVLNWNCQIPVASNRAQPGTNRAEGSYGWSWKMTPRQYGVCGQPTTMAHCKRSVTYVSCTGFEHDSWMNQKMNCSLWMMTITPTMTRTWCWGWGWWDHAAVVVMKRWSFRFFRSLLSNSCETDIVWLVIYLPLWKIWVRQLGLLFPTEWKVIKFHGSSHHQPVVVHLVHITPAHSAIVQQRQVVPPYAR